MDKPEFDPNQSFEPVKTGFDPNQPFEAVSDQEQEPSTLSDLGLGAAQGATFGFSDEVLAALQAAKEVATTEKTLKDLPSLYRQLQQVEQQKIAEARERSPIAFTTGEIGAGILPALFTGGATAVASGAKAAATGAKAATGFLPSVMGAAKAGAGYGALAAAGTTEKPIEDTGEFAGEVVKGGVAGGTIGGALGAAGRAVKGLAGTLDDTSVIRQAKTAYEEGKAGRTFAGDIAEKRLLKQETQAALEKTQNIIDTKSKLGKLIEASLDTAEAAGTKIRTSTNQQLNTVVDAYTYIQKNPEDFGSFDNEKILSALNKLVDGTLGPKEANEIRKKIKDLGELAKSGPLKRLKNIIEEQLYDIEGFQQANRTYSKFLESTAETIYGKGTPVEVLETYFSNLTKGEQNLFRDIERLIRKAQAPGTSGDAQKKTLIALEENLAKLEAERPGFLKTIGFDPEKFVSSIKEEADVSSIGQAIRGYEPQSGPGKQFLSAITPRAMTYRAAETLGQTSRVIGKSTPVKLASKVYSAAEPELRSMAEKLMSNPATRRFGEGLAGSLDKPGGVARRAVLFSIMQSPEARKAVSELYPGVGEE